MTQVRLPWYKIESSFTARPGVTVVAVQAFIAEAPALNRIAHHTISVGPVNDRASVLLDFWDYTTLQFANELDKSWEALVKKYADFSKEAVTSYSEHDTDNGDVDTWRIGPDALVFRGIRADVRYEVRQRLLHLKNLKTHIAKATGAIIVR